VSRHIWSRLGAIAAVAAGGGLLAVVSAPAREVAQPRDVDVDPPAPVVLCPGEQSVPVGDVGSGGDLGSVPTVRALHVYSPGQTHAAAAGTVADAALGSQVERIGDGDIAGWSALSCSEPTTDQWLVGGATTLGSSARLVLTNASPAPSEATVTLYGPLGEVEDTLVIPVAALSQADHLLESFATAQSSLVVHVQATAGGVSAALQDSRLIGFQPAGTSWVGPSQALTDQVIAGVGFDSAGGSVTVRLMAPQGATVKLTVVSERGVEQWSTGTGISLDPGVVTDVAVPVSRLGAIEVNADAEVFASARTVMTRAATTGVDADTAADATWVSGMAVRDEPLAVVTPVDQARLAVYSPYATTVVATDENGVSVGYVSVPARTIQWLDVDAPAGTVVTITGQVAWSVVMVSPDGFVASLMPSLPQRDTLHARVLASPYPAGS